MPVIKKVKPKINYAVTMALMEMLRKFLSLGTLLGDSERTGATPAAIKQEQVQEKSFDPDVDPAFIVQTGAKANE